MWHLVPVGPLRALHCQKLAVTDHGCIIASGYSDFHRPPFIPMKAAQWCMKQKWLDFAGLKIRCSSALLQHHGVQGTCALVTLLLPLCVIQVERLLLV